MRHHILCINSGSSSMKFAMYGLGESEKLIAEGAVERIGLPGGALAERMQKASAWLTGMTISRRTRMR